MEEEKKDLQVMHDFDESKSGFFSMKLVLTLIIVAVLGIGTGYMLRLGSVGNSVFPGGGVMGGSAQKGKTYGSNDTKTYKDVAEGVLEEGGIEGEGQYHLVRPGGESQNVYLTSSTVDLAQFQKKKVKVWGQTQDAQKAGWLMDVGRVEVL